MNKNYRLALLLGSSLIASQSFSSDLFRLSGSAASDGAAGLIGLAPNAQTAVLGNPALLGRAEDGLNFSLTSLRVNSEFTSRLGQVATADKGPGIIPELGFKADMGVEGWTWGAGFVVQSAMKADFRFQDPPGTGGVSYGVQQHSAEWLVAKLAGAISYQFTDQLSAGLSLGVAYNRNQLEAPYIFQSHPVLTGLKVLVDLDADDIAVTSSLGLDYNFSENVAFNLAYTFATDFSAEGDLSGNLGQLGLGIQENFSYAANVETTLPAVLLAGVTWQASDQLTLGLQIDQIYWDDAFDVLPIRLTSGSNGDLNTFLGEDHITDVAPLGWDDQTSVHLGGEYTLGTGTRLRLGYESSEAPVAAATATPMTGAILDEAWTAGMQFQLGSRAIDVAYRFARGDDLSIVDSALAGGEYDLTSQSLILHSLSVSFQL